MYSTSSLSNFKCIGMVKMRSTLCRNKYQTELHIIMELDLNVNDSKEDTKERLSTWEHSNFKSPRL